MRISISISEPLAKKVKEIAQENGQTFSGIIRICLEGYVKDVQQQTDQRKVL